MKPEPDYVEAALLRRYVEAVAEQVGVEAAATWSEYGSPSIAYVALAEWSVQYPERLLMLQWRSDRGWCLALEPERGEAPCVLVAWSDSVRPVPADVAARLRQALRSQPDAATAITTTDNQHAAG